MSHKDPEARRAYHAQKPYGCHNREPFKDTVVVQDGYYEAEDGFGNPVRSPKYKRIPFTGARNCVYTLSDLGQVDPRCTGCRWAAGLLQAPSPNAGEGT